LLARFPMDLLDEMQQGKSVQACIDLALTDAYGQDEEAVAWLTCLETMSVGRIERRDRSYHYRDLPEAAGDRPTSMRILPIDLHGRTE
jgi:hypothetical protein